MLYREKATLVIFYTFMLCKLEFFIVKPKQALGLRCIIKLRLIKMEIIEEYCLCMHVICQQHLIHSLFIYVFLSSMRFYFSTSK